MPTSKILFFLTVTKNLKMVTSFRVLAPSRSSLLSTYYTIWSLLLYRSSSSPTMLHIILLNTMSRCFNFGKLSRSIFCENYMFIFISFASCIVCGFLYPSKYRTTTIESSTLKLAGTIMMWNRFPLLAYPSSKDCKS